MQQSQTTQKRIVQECFEGQYDRDCSRCPAHYTKGGICCFGHRFEYDDQQCHDCVHSDACEPLTYQLQEQRVERPRRSRPSVSRRRLPIYGQRGGETKGNLLQESEGPTPTAKGEEPMVCYLPTRSGKEGKWKHFFRGMGLMGVWGAGEGALELMLGYLRRRRPE